MAAGGSVQDESVEPLGPRPFEDFVHQPFGNALAPPLRLGEDVQHDGVSPRSNTLRTASGRMRKDTAALHSSANNHLRRMVDGARKPTDVLANRKRCLKIPERVLLQLDAGIAGKLAHRHEHLRAMARDVRDVVQRGKADHDRLPWASLS